ncbi:MAG: site-2 protease family protein [Clostridia bacterium]|nr:site-2 protease family protein [Clostridia bacterium]
MKKIKVSVWAILLLILSFVFNKFLLIFNYLLALLLHELAHVFVAENKGYKLKQFRFDVFGFSVELDEKIEDRDAFLINLAGPLCNVAICIGCLGMFWLLPASYLVLKTFCLCNFVLAVFNLLPIYPLDGGKLFRSLIKNDKVYGILNGIIKWGTGLGFLIVFVVSVVWQKINFYFLLFAVFFLFNKQDKSVKFSLFKTKKEKQFLKIKLLKIDEDAILLEAVKKIKHGMYTMFYVGGQVKKFIDEDTLVDLCIKNNLHAKFCELEFKD